MRRVIFVVVATTVLLPLNCHGQFLINFIAEGKKPCFSITLVDIEKVDWQNQLFSLSPLGISKLKDAQCDFESFDVVLNDSIIYSGKMEPAHRSAIALTEPAILYSDNQLFVGNGFRFAIFYKGKGDDVRFNQNLFDFLKDNNKTIGQR
ncbi:MAG: hypothetical protein ACKOE6_16485 [Flammeovirgaceae bacterium]